MTAGCAVLDVGSGRHPAIPADQRPADVRYVGLDVSAEELAAAESGAYTESVAADATHLQPNLVGQFDLVISWQVLEHVRDLPETISHVHKYLRPGGTFVALFSGGFSVFAIANRVLPNKLGSRIVDPIMRRSANNRPVFPAFYDKCYDRALKKIFAPWQSANIVPLFQGANYFGFSAIAQRGYLAYENFIARRRVADLATHYLVIAST
ncbi:MAG: class I SAM-dependent methyltransferase [Solirubrobacteraceae bacterium]|nr:class I SAM-dependent methyltransferase [Solirubrobacteraceae bacterium]